MLKQFYEIELWINFEKTTTVAEDVKEVIYFNAWWHNVPAVAVAVANKWGTA